MISFLDMMVSDQDYDDCAKHLQTVLDNYVPDLSINQEYIECDTEQFDNNPVKNDSEKDSPMVKDTHRS